MKKIYILTLITLVSFWGFGQSTKMDTKMLNSSKTTLHGKKTLGDVKLPVIAYAPSQSKVSYLTQNFDGTWIPTGWTQTVVITAKTWQRANPLSTPFTTIDPTNVYSAICPYSLPSETQNEWLKSPSVTGTSSAAALQLKFWAGYSYDYLPAGGQGVPGATLICKISTNGGTTWTTLWDANNTPSFTGWVWRQVILDISSYKAAPFMIAWQVSGADGDLMALDNIVIEEPPTNDVGITAITAPVSSCTTLSASENVTVTVKNFGSATITSFPISYKVNNGAPVTATYTGSLISGATGTYTFTGANAANLSTPGNYTIKAYSALTGDVVLTNDTAAIAIYSGAATVPYFMGFENTESLAGWSYTDVNNDTYSWSIYSQAKYAHTGLGFAGYQYNVDGTTAADDWLFTKCINLVSGTSYQLKFYYRPLSSSFAEAMNVSIGTTNSVAGMTTQLVDLPSITDTTYPSSTTIFTVPSSGNYYIGFHVKSAADMYALLIDDISVDIVTGVASVENNEINVYPNPARNVINIDGTNISIVEMYNLVGEKVLSSINKNSIDVSSLDKGIYFIKIKQGENIFTKKISIVK